MTGRVAAIVPAAGRGERLGPGVPKALRLLGGLPMLVHAVRALSQARTVDLVIVAGPPEVAPGELDLHAYDLPTEVRVVAGGPTRQESVRRALAALAADIDVVLVHDAARPLAPSELADAVVAAVRAGADAVVPGLSVSDTVKQVDVSGRVVGTLRRDDLRAIQTPQGFRRSALESAHSVATLDEATDDAALIERAGGTVHVIAGHPEAFKVTRPIDLVFAEAVLAARRVRHGG